LKSSILNKRVKLLEQQARNVYALLDADKAAVAWSAFQNELSTEELYGLIAFLQETPFTTDEPVVKELASASGHSAQTCAELLTESLALQLQVLNYQRTQNPSRRDEPT
jgi:hypothetical protein